MLIEFPFFSWSLVAKSRGAGALYRRYNSAGSRSGEGRCGSSEQPRASSRRCVPRARAAARPAALVPPARVEAISAGDWRQPNRDPAGTRFSPLEQIHTDNVTHLVEAWRYPLPRRAAREPVLAGGYELTPLAIGGVLYA